MRSGTKVTAFGYFCYTFSTTVCHTDLADVTAVAKVSPSKASKSGARIKGEAMAIRPRGTKAILSLYRRVPKRYEAVEPRKFVWVSLHTDSQSVAASKATVAWDLMIEGWEARLAGDSSDAETRFEAARELAAVRGFRYLNASTVAKLPLEEILQRVETVPGTAAKSDLIEASAVLGGAMEPPITVSRALELFWTLAADRTIGKSDDQQRRWKNPYMSRPGR